MGGDHEEMNYILLLDGIKCGGEQCGLGKKRGESSQKRKTGAFYQPPMNY